MFHFFPAQDAPAHLYNALLLKDFIQGPPSWLSKYYQLNGQPDPTWFGHGILLGLFYLMSPLIAEKVLITGYMVALPLAIRYAVRALDPSASYLAILAMPFVENYFLHMGFFSFVFSIAVAFLTLGYWLRNKENLGLRQTIILTLLSLLLYLCHIVSVGAVYLTIGVLVSTDVLRDVRWSHMNVRQSLKRRFFPLVLASLPTLLLAAVFVFSRHTETIPGNSPLQRLMTMAMLTSLVSFKHEEVIVSFSLVIVFVFLLTHFDWRSGLRQRHSNDALLLAVIALVLLDIFIPETQLISRHGLSGGGYLERRLQLYPFLVLLLWFASKPSSLRVRNVTRTCGVAVTLGLLILHWGIYQRANNELQKYVSAAPYIRPGSTLLPLNMQTGGVSNPANIHSQPLTTVADPFWHASDYIALERNAISFDNYETTTGYFPLLFRQNVDPYKHMGMLQIHPPNAHFLDYNKRTGGQVDYVLEWLPKQVNETPEGRSIERQLRKGYRLIYVSRPHGLVRLYEKRSSRG